ncbi:[protein-PII] uridylyltransferase [Candidatus Sumerlaeota bacterium]|nr:[protein-PII] uridylyltransferase [Candidatus Sumerlaeota bacterium]
MKDGSAHPIEEELHEGDIEFPPDLPHEKLIESCKEMIARAQAQMLETNRKSSGRSASQRFARFHDLLLRALFKHVLLRWEARGEGSPGSLALIALGGYGRRDLSLRSDIDILLLIADRTEKQEAFVKEFLYILFDLKLELGYAVRRLEDCLNVIGLDLQSTTAMIESRWVAGSKPLFQHFHEFFFRALRGRGLKWFLQALYTEWQERRQKYEASIYLVQPNIKENEGGLRDIHSVRWGLAAVTGSMEMAELTGLGILSEAELRHYRQAEEFILKLRNELHALSPRKNDVLNFESQVEITRRLEFEPTETMLAEEALMREYYRRAREIAKFSNRAFMTLMRREKGILGSVIGTLKRKRLDQHFLAQDGVIWVDDKHPKYLEKHPDQIMTLFARARKLGLRVSEKTRDVVERIVPSLGDEFRESEVCRKQFMEIMRGPFNVAQTLADMHDCGLLCAYIPEFEHIHCMVRIDHYHRYTVDEHLLKAVESCERLLKEPEAGRSHAAKVAHEIERLDLLNLSLLLHDVGKGYGKGHALRGGQIVQRVGIRMGLDPDDIEMLRFLVLSHLKIGHVSQRRDLDDPKVGRDLAEEVGSLDRLKTLYVHSVCDAMAVSPESWSDWKARLFEGCYRGAAAAFGQIVEESPKHEHPRAQITARIWDYITDHPPEGFPRKDEEELARLRKRLDEFLESVPDRYLQIIRIETIAQHFWMIQRLDEKERIMWELNQGLGTSEIVVCSADVPGSFAKTCGAFAAKEMNILSAQIFSTSDGYGINVFQVTDLRGQPLPDGFRLDRLRADLNQVFLEKKTIEELIERYKPKWGVARTSSPRPTEIRVDNDGSQEFTILEVRTGDRPGLLYQIASVLDSHKLNINRAMVSTEAYGVMDVFYVTDLEYNKIHDESRIARLQDDLKRALDAAAASAALTT